MHRTTRKPRPERRVRETCPKCGYCDKCGRSNAAPVWPYPVTPYVPYVPPVNPYPWGPFPYTIATSGTTQPSGTVPLQSVCTNEVRYDGKTIKLDHDNSLFVQTSPGCIIDKAGN